jgi:tetratricopeptide (TPR) repeat protein
MKRIIAAIRYLFRSLFGFFIAWITSTPWLSIVVGLPFWIAMGFLAFVFFQQRDPIRRDVSLTRQLGSALNRSDFETAKLLLERKLQDRPDDRSARLQMAQVLAENEETEAATRMMFQLALNDVRAGDLLPITGKDGTVATPKVDPKIFRFGEGDPQAGMWLIGKYYGKKAAKGELSEADLAVVDKLLPWLYSSYPDNVDLANLYGERLLTLKMLGEALTLYEGIADKDPKFRFNAAFLSRLEGNETRAREHAERLLEEVSRLDSDDLLSYDNRLKVSAAYTFLNRYPEALQTLSNLAGATTDPDKKRQAEVLFAQTLITWNDTIDKKSQKTVQDHQQMIGNLQDAMKVAPDDPAVLEFLSRYVLEATVGGDEQLSEMQKALMANSSPGVTHFIQGTSAALKGNKEDAALHLDLALKSLPNSTVVLNNLAYTMSQGEDADLPKALTLIDEAIAKLPEPKPQYYDTRGNILLKMERWADAIPPLEAISNEPALGLAAHQGLAICYEKLGNEELARVHRVIAANLAGEKPAPETPEKPEAIEKAGESAN